VKKAKDNEAVRPAGTGFFYLEESLLINDAISYLAVKVHSYKKKYGKKAVLFTGCGASNGTTKIAVNLAMALSQSGHKTLLIDADVRKGSVLDNGLCDFLQRGSDFDKVVRPSNLPGLDFVPSGSCEKNSALLLCSGLMADFMGIAASKYDYVIIDCPSVTVSSDAAAMFMNADGIVLVCSLNETTKRQLQSAKNAVEPYSDKYYGLVVNSLEEKKYKRLFPQCGYYRGREHTK